MKKTNTQFILDIVDKFKTESKNTDVEKGFNNWYVNEGYKKLDLIGKTAISRADIKTIKLVIDVIDHLELTNLEKFDAIIEIVDITYNEIINKD